MRWWIEDGQVVGKAPGIAPPGNILEVEGTDAPGVEYVYFDGQEVRLKPSRPSPTHTWDALASEWVDTTPSEMEPEPAPGLTYNWALVEDGLRGSTMFTKCWFAAEHSGAALRNLTQFQLSLDRGLTRSDAQEPDYNSNPALRDFIFALNTLRTSVHTLSLENPVVSDFDQSEIQAVLDLLEECGFNLAHFPLQIA